MTDLVTVGAFWIAILAGVIALLLLAAWCGWYIRIRERGLKADVTQQINAVADGLARKLDDQLGAATRDFALATAKINEAAQQIDRVESGFQAQARINEGTAQLLAKIQQDLHSGRYRAEPHPATVDELERIHARLQAIDERTAAMGRAFEEALLAVSLRYRRPGQA